MTRNKTIAWGFWIAVIVGLVAMGACKGTSPTSPGPSDVQDFSFSGGDDIDKQEITPLVDELENLIELGGGARFVDEDDGYTLVGTFDRYSGDPVPAHMIVQQAGEDPIVVSFTEMALMTGLVYPVTLTVTSPQYVTQTLVETTANVIAFGLVKLSNYDLAAIVTGYTFSTEDSDHLWMVKGATTHLNRDWVVTWGPPASNPYVVLMANPYQPVGGVAFLYQGDGLGVYNPSSLADDPEIWDLQGYSYSHIGTLDPGSVGAWIMNLTQTGTGNTYDEGAYTVEYSFPWSGDMGSFVHGSLTVTPGGCRDDSCEFIPYYPPQDFAVAAEDGTYEITAFDPPTLTDRDVIVARLAYADGASDTRIVNWDPAGTTVPDIDFGPVPGCTTANFTINQHGTLAVEWTNDAAAGLQVLTVKDENGIERWTIYVSGAATETPADGILIPPYVENPQGIGFFQGFDFGQGTIQVARIECPGVNLNDFDWHTVWTNTAAIVTSGTEDVTAETTPTP